MKTVKYYLFNSLTYKQICSYSLKTNFVEIANTGIDVIEFQKLVFNQEYV